MGNRDDNLPVWLTTYFNKSFDINSKQTFIIM